MRLFAPSRRAIFARIALGLATLVAPQGCSDDDNPVEPGSGNKSAQLSGVYVSYYDGGKMTITIPLASTLLAPPLGGSAQSHDVAVTGLLTPGGLTTVTLTGTYNEETDSLYVTGTNPGDSSPYIMAGKYDPAGSIPGIAGFYQGPNAPGGFVLAVGGSSTVTTYCGDTTHDGDTSSGRLSLVIVGTHVTGTAAILTGTGISAAVRLYSFEGTVTGTVPNQTITVNQVLGDQDPVDGLVLVTQGTLDATAGTITNGTWETQLDGTTRDSGTWDGSTLCHPVWTN